VLVME